MSEKQRGWVVGGLTVTGTLLGILIGAALGALIGGLLGSGLLGPVQPVSDTPEARAFAGPINLCLAFVGVLIGAVLGGLVVAVGGAVLGSVLGAVAANVATQGSARSAESIPGRESTSE